jgi:hypothetical protein
MEGRDMESPTNVTFDEIRVGDTANVSRKLSTFEVEDLALVGGNVDAFHVADGQWSPGEPMHAGAVGVEALLSGLLNRKLPGLGRAAETVRGFAARQMRLPRTPPAGCSLLIFERRNPRPHPACAWREPVKAGGISMSHSLKRTHAARLQKAFEIAGKGALSTRQTL